MTVWLAGSRSATAERIATVFPVPTSPVIIAIVFSDDGPGDARGGLAAVVVAVQPRGGQVPAERHAGEPEPGDDGVDHQNSPSSSGAGLPWTAASCCWAFPRSRARAAALVRASEMNSQAPLTAAAGSVPSSQPSRPAAKAAASHRPTWASSWGRPAAAERQLADQLVGVGGLVQALAAEGGVVQGADRPGRGAGQGQRLLRGVSHGLSVLPLFRSSLGPAGR